MCFSYFYILQRQWIWDVNSVFNPLKLMVLLKSSASCFSDSWQAFRHVSSSNGSDADHIWVAKPLPLLQSASPQAVRDEHPYNTDAPGALLPDHRSLRKSTVHIFWIELKSSTFLCVTGAALVGKLQSNKQTKLHRNGSIHSSYIHNL